jgi:large subunit ribosomal protein L18
MAKLIPRLARRKKRVSSKISGNTEMPRVAIHRSNKYIYAQVVNDEAEKTLTGISTVKIEKSKTISKADSAREAGKQLAELLKEKKVTKVVFDRSRFLYLGRVKNFVEGLREGGIQV